MVERRALVGRPSVVGGYEWRIVNGKLWSDTALVGRPSAVGGKGQWAESGGRWPSGKDTLPGRWEAEGC